MRCLERDPKQRLRDIGDAGHDLGQPLDSPTLAARALACPPCGRQSRRLPVRRGGGRGADVDAHTNDAGHAGGRARELSASRGSAHGAPTPASGNLTGRPPHCHPRGWVCPTQPRESAHRSLEWTVVPATHGAVGVFFSADSQFVGFWTTKAIKKVPVGGGSPVTIHEIDLPQNDGPDGVTWADDGKCVLRGRALGHLRGAGQRRSAAPGREGRGDITVCYSRQPCAALRSLGGRRRPALHVMLTSLDGGDEVDLGEGDALGPCLTAPSSLFAAIRCLRRHSICGRGA